MKCPSCGVQITYRADDFGEFHGSTLQRAPIEEKVCRCHVHGNNRHCRQCCEHEQALAEKGELASADAFIELKPYKPAVQP